MDTTTIKAKIANIASKRELLLQLMERPNLGTLRIDVDQALEELDELIEEFHETFPQENNPSV
jgi:hypothetical protein